MPKKTLGDISSRPRCKTFLLAWRKYRRLSQQKAADKIGVSYTTVGRKERGANVDQAYLEAAAKAYRCEPVDFFKPPPWLTAETSAPDLAAVRRVFDHVLIGLDEAERIRQKAPPAPDPPSQPEPEAPTGGSKSSKKSAPRKRP